LLPKKLKRLQRNLKDGDLKEIFKGSSIAFVYRVLGLFLNYYLLMIIPRRFNVESLGIYNLATNFLAIAALLGTMGFNTSVLRFTAQYNVQGKYTKIANFYKGIIKAVGILSLTFSILIFVFASQIAITFYHNPDLTIPLKIIAFTLPFQVILNIDIEFIRGLKKIQYSEYLRNLNQPLINTIVIFSAGFAVFTFLNFNELPLIGYTLGVLISLIFSIVVISKFLKNNKTDSTGENNPDDNFSLKEQLKVSSPMIITSFAHIMQARLGLQILAMMSTIQSVAAYSVAARLAILTTFVQMAVNTISASKFSELFWENKIDELNKVVTFSTRMVFMVSLPAVILLISFPKFLLGLVDPQIENGATALVLLAIAQFISACSGSVGTFLNMTGHQVVLRNIVLLGIAINIILCVLLIPKFDLIGTAVANLVSVSFWNVAGAIYVYKKYKIKTFYIPFIQNKIGK
jgi:O-antigen/teichoic acid export membrane protein